MNSIKKISTPFYIFTYESLRKKKPETLFRVSFAKKEVQ